MICVFIALLVAPVRAQTGARLNHLLNEAEQGSPEAQYQLGFRYATGLGTAQNYTEAAKWYGKAAAQGVAQAQQGLGELLAEGHGVKRDYVEAYKWFDIALVSWADSFYGDMLRHERNILAKKMTPAQVGQAKQRADAWVKAFAARQKNPAANQAATAAAPPPPEEKTAKEPAAKIPANRTTAKPAPKPRSASGNKTAGADRRNSKRRVLLVGPTRRLKKPSAAARVARPGDLIEIDAGEYKDCAVWRTPNIRIQGVGGYAHVKDISCDGKAIWVFYASPVQISHVRFSGARVIHNNGAGIRWEGSGRLVIENSWIHNNQMGILTHNVKKSRLIVKHSKFEENGDCPNFCGHGIYAGRIRHLSVSNSEFVGHKHGHHIKSRAYFTDIMGNRISDGPRGTASFAIDLPDSGTANIRYNFIEKGPKADNKKGVISIGEEGERIEGGSFNPSRFIKIESNVFLNSGRRPTNFVWNRGRHPVTLRSNKFTGPGARYRGYGHRQYRPN